MNITPLNATIIIPVWNGVGVISECLTQLYAASGPAMLEVICVDNGSSDTSVEMIRTHFPQVRLLPQTHNLGFAGGVNVGLHHAQGDLLILLNQDCLVQPGWLDALMMAAQNYPHFGILGCVILNRDSSVDHAGLRVISPCQQTRHLTTIQSSEPYAVEAVTGALFAIRRTTWQAIGDFDEGFYPAYYEEMDYCYRARHKGIEIGCAPAVRVEHLFFRRWWERDPIEHATSVHQMRYRFAVKHLTSKQIDDFFGCELAETEREPMYEEAQARLLAAQATRRTLDTISEQRQLDLGDRFSDEEQHKWTIGFEAIQQRARHRTEILFTDNSPASTDWAAQQKALLDQIYFTAQLTTPASETRTQRWRRLLLRTLSLLCGRDYLLHRKLAYLGVLRQNELEQRIKIIEAAKKRE